jgi:hypothetical protein
VTETPKVPTKTEEVKKGSEGLLYNKPSSNAMKEVDDENQNEILKKNENERIKKKKEIY